VSQLDNKVQLISLTSGTFFPGLLSCKIEGQIVIFILLCSNEYDRLQIIDAYPLNTTRSGPQLHDPWSDGKGQAADSPANPYPFRCTLMP
jgi:hypothetical protein